MASRRRAGNRPFDAVNAGSTDVHSIYTLKSKE